MSKKPKIAQEPGDRVSWFFESLFVGVQNLDVEFVRVSEFVEDVRDYIGAVVFAYAESALAVAQIGVDPSEMRGIKRIQRHCL